MRKFSTYLLAVVILFTSSAMVMAENKKVDEKKNDLSTNAAELNFELTKSDYEYQIENRPDPFVPFYKEETSTEPILDPNEVIDPDSNLSGMQYFEPGQLTLVGVIKVKGENFAMVEDFTGRGYIVEQGMKIGRRGVIKSIEPNKVFIEEVAVTRAGKELRSETVMALRKEGEE